MTNHFPPVVSAREMAEVDRLMIEDFQISLVQMMELAGRHLADLAEKVLADRQVRLSEAQITILAGSGHNGGGGLTAARHLHNRGARITIILGSTLERLKPTTRVRFETLQRLNIPFIQSEYVTPKDVQSTDLILDALIGYNLVGEPRGLAAELVECVLKSGNPHVLSLDVPTGFSAHEGRFTTLALTSEATLTLALPKRGMEQPEIQSRLGKLYLGDIGVPKEVYTRMGIVMANPFSEGPLLRLI